MRIQVLGRGAWSGASLPIDEVEDLDRARRAAGYVRVSSVDVGERALIPRVQVWQLQEEEQQQAGSADRLPGYLLDVHLQETMEVVGAATFTDLMEMLSRWAPALQAAVGIENLQSQIG